MAYACRRARLIRLGLAVAAVLIAGNTVSAAPSSEPIAVQLDRARLIKMPERATTVVIGDPLIADVSLQPGGLAVITAKGYGATNMIILDHDGAVLAEHSLQVTGPIDPTVVVFRGTSRETYSCAPECLPRITLGDDPDYFTKVIAETASRTGQATSIGSQSGGSAPAAPAH